MRTWFRRLGFFNSPIAARRPRAVPLRLELLEDRVTPSVTITVTTAMDDNTPGNGSVSLREAINAINSATPPTDPDIIAEIGATPTFGPLDTINFNISGAGTVQTINVGSTGLGALPTLMKPTVINGYSETGASMNTLANSDNAKILIELNGADAGANADGLLLGTGSAGSTIEGLAINRFSLNGIEAQSGSNFIQGNFVGTNPAGNAAEPNQNDGILISNSSNNTIGGTTPADRNIASGNTIDGIRVLGTLASPADLNLIEGNFVGVNAAGTGSVGTKTTGAIPGSPAGNDFFGIEISGGDTNTVGGTTAGARNVVGFNSAGIEVDDGGKGNIIQGNYSGVGADGVTPVGNSLHGIVIRSADNLGPPLGPGQANEPPTSGNIIGLNPNTGFSGLGNLVEFNGTAGIAVFGNPLPNNATPIQNSGNSILGNSFFENGRLYQTVPGAPLPLLGIDLTNSFTFPRDDGFTANDSKGHGAANDPNNFQNFPTLTSVTQVAGGVQISGTFTEAAEPNTMLRIEFYANNPDPLGLQAEGQTFLGFVNVTTNASGFASFSMTLNDPNVHVGQSFTADATNLTADPSAQAVADALYNTSEFSPGITLQPVLVGEFSNGVNEYVSGSTWTLLTQNGIQASLLAVGANGTIVGEFSNGVNEYVSGTTWKLLTQNNVQASLLAVDANGDVFAEFQPYGVMKYLSGTTWQAITATGVNASLLTAGGNGNVVAEFPGYGVQRFISGTNWQPLTPSNVNASVLAMNNNGDVVGNFPGYGVQIYTTGPNFQPVTPTNASLLGIDSNADIVGEFPGIGLYRYTGNPPSGMQIDSQDASLLAVDDAGDAFVEFPQGVFELAFNNVVTPLTPELASILAVS